MAVAAELRSHMDIKGVKDEIALRRVRNTMAVDQASKRQQHLGRGKNPRQQPVMGMRDKKVVQEIEKGVLQGAQEEEHWARVGRAVLQEPEASYMWESADPKQGEHGPSRCLADEGGGSGLDTFEGESSILLKLGGSNEQCVLPRALQRLPRLWARMGTGGLKAERDACYRALNAEIAPQVRSLTARAYDLAIGTSSGGKLPVQDRVQLDKQIARVAKQAYGKFVAREEGELRAMESEVERLAKVIAQERRSEREAGRKKKGEEGAEEEEQERAAEGVGCNGNNSKLNKRRKGGATAAPPRGGPGGRLLLLSGETSARSGEWRDGAVTLPAVTQSSSSTRKQDGGTSRDGGRRRRRSRSGSDEGDDRGGVVVDVVDVVAWDRTAAPVLQTMERFMEELERLKQRKQES